MSQWGNSIIYLQKSFYFWTVTNPIKHSMVNMHETLMKVLKYIIQSILLMYLLPTTLDNWPFEEHPTSQVLWKYKLSTNASLFLPPFCIEYIYLGHVKIFLDRVNWVKILILWGKTSFQIHFHHQHLFSSNSFAVRASYPRLAVRVHVALFHSHFISSPLSCK